MKQNIRYLTLFLCFIIFPYPAFADRQYEIARAIQKIDAQMFAEAYIKDLRQKIAEEKYETIPKISERFSLRQSGSLRNETAYRISKPHEFTKIKNQLILAETGKISDALRFKVSGRFYYDAVFDVTNNFKENVESDQERETEFRDTYIDYSKGQFDLRLGKQQIVWGEAVGLFFADVVNAKDLREYVLPDFDMVRIPQWALDLEYSKENFHSEFVFIPVLEFHKTGVSQSEFTFPYPVPTGAGYTGKDPAKPANNLKNSETGCRLSYLLNTWDLGIFYLHTWNKFPVMYRTISSGVYNFSPEYERQDITGATFSKEINDIVLKGESVFYRDGYFSIFDSTDTDGVVRKSFIDYLLGIDYTFFDKIDTNLQFMQRAIFNHTNLLADNERKFNNSLSFWLKTDLLNEKLEPEFLVIASLMEPDFLYRPKFTLKFKDNWRVRLGADIFQGQAAGVFGRFDKKSRVYSEIIYDF